MSMGTIIETFPLAAAVGAIWVCSKTLQKTNDKKEYARLSLNILAAVVMIIAQTSWYTVHVLYGDTVDNSFANYLWTFFNSLIMIIMIVFPSNGQTKNNIK